MDYLNGIDFRKGCYVGQELTIRTQHTGVIRKRILPVQLYDESESIPSKLEYSNKKSYDVQQGADIKAEGGKRPAGKVLASVGNVGLALCRLENMTDMRVSAEGGSYKVGLEFFVPTSDGQGKAVEKAERSMLQQELVQLRTSCAVGETLWLNMMCICTTVLQLYEQAPALCFERWEIWIGIAMEMFQRLITSASLAWRNLR